MFNLKDAGVINKIRVASTTRACDVTCADSSLQPAVVTIATAVDMQTEVETKASDEGHLLLANQIYEVLDPDLSQCVAKQQQENQAENQEENQRAELEGPQPDCPQTQPAESVDMQPEDATLDLTELRAWCSSATFSVRNPAEKVPDNQARQPQAEEPLATTEEPEIGEPQGEAEKPRGKEVEPKTGEPQTETREPEAGESRVREPRVETKEPQAEEAEASPLMSNAQDQNKIAKIVSRLKAEVDHRDQELTAGNAPEQDRAEAMEEGVTREQEAAGDSSAKATTELKVPAGGAVERQYTATALSRLILTARIAVTDQTSPLEGATEQQDEDSDAELLSEPEQIGSTPTPSQEEEGAPQWPEGDEWDAVELEGDKPQGAETQDDALTISVTISGLRSAIKIYISPVEPRRSRPKQRGR